MKIALRMLTATIALGAYGLAQSSSPPPAPAEVTAAAPTGMTLLSFKASDTQAASTAAAVYETAPDRNGVRHRQLILFGKANGVFVPEATSGKVIACSTCSQYHDDQFYPHHVEVSAEHVHIDQFDSGEMPSTTSFDLVRKQNQWIVTKATRVTYVGGSGDPHREMLPIPASGLVQDMDGRWSVPTYFKAIVVNDSTGRFSFPHGFTSMKALQDSIADDYTCKSAAGCHVLLQSQHDGCLSLVRDGNGKFFGASNTDPESKAGAADKAMAACKAGNGSSCEEVRTDCSKGIF